MALQYDGEWMRLTDEAGAVLAEAKVRVQDGTVFIGNLVSYDGRSGYTLMCHMDKFVRGRSVRVVVDWGEKTERLMRLYIKRFGMTPVGIILERSEEIG